MEPRVVYLTQMEVPSKRAHAIQIFKTCAALSRLGLRVELVVERGCISPGQVEETYGVSPEPSRFSVVEAIRTPWTILRLSGPETVFYTRSQRWARLAIRTGPLHGNPVVFETHRKAGVFKNDPETGIPEPVEKRRRIEWIFHHADGVVCAVEATERWLRHQGVKTLHLWYGWTHRGFSARGPAHSFAYAGTKDIEVVLRAFERLPWARLTVYGVPESKMHLFSHLPNVEPVGFIPHARLLRELTKHGGFIATNEGIKLADYLSLGGAIVAPALPSVREILGQGAAYYRFGDPQSLAMAVDGVAVSAAVENRFTRHARLRRKRFFWPEKAESLAEFLVFLGF